MVNSAIQYFGDFIEWVSSRNYDVFVCLCLKEVKCMYNERTKHWYFYDVMVLPGQVEGLWFGQCYAIAQYATVAICCSAWRQAIFSRCWFSFLCDLYPSPRKHFAQSLGSSKPLWSL